MGWTAAGVVVSALGAAASGVQNAQAQNAASQGRRDQSEAQGRAEATALSAQIQEEDALRAENRKTPDVSNLIGDADTGGLGNLLTGVGGVDPNKLNLGRSTVLGG